MDILVALALGVVGGAVYADVLKPLVLKAWAVLKALFGK